MIKGRFSPEIQQDLSDDIWMILQKGYRPEETSGYESLFCLSNGCLGTRDTYEKGVKNSLPYTSISDAFGKSEAFMRELANMSDWLDIRFYVERELIDIDACRILESIRALDTRHAPLVGQCILEDRKGRKTLIEGIRTVSRANAHRLGTHLLVTPLNYSGLIEMGNILDGSVINFGDAPRFKVKHTRLLQSSCLDTHDTYLEVITRDRKLCMGTGSHMETFSGGQPMMKNHSSHTFGEMAVEFQGFEAEQGKTVGVVRYTAIYTEWKAPDYKIHYEVRDKIRQPMADGFDAELSHHTAVYAQIQEDANIEIQRDFELDRAVRFAIFHLTNTGNERDEHVSAGAKLLSGEEYGGHAFWGTELLMLPFFACVFPGAARNLENYRYHLLDAVRENARKNGYRGTQYPWESAGDGTKQCPDWAIGLDGTCYRCCVAVYGHYVTTAVVYGIYHYVRLTGDKRFLKEKGVEILIETTRFWASRCEYHETFRRFEIRQVIGPDEWHELADNNLCANYLAKWNLSHMLNLLREWETTEPVLREELKNRLFIEGEEREHWQNVMEHMYLPRGKDNGLLGQFEDYFDLQDVTIEACDENDRPIHPKVLETVPRSQTQIIKWADVVMLLHLLGEEFDEETRKKNYAYYKKRALHGSSLSPSIHSMMGLRVGGETKAYRYLCRAAFISLTDLQKNTREGVHATSAGGVWQAVVFGFAGVSMEEDDVVDTCSHMPKEWGGLSFRLHYYGAKLSITMTSDNQADVKLLKDSPVIVRVNGEVWVMGGTPRENIWQSSD